uniref:non-specific serine/threonine protein kinase n=1 Tax=Caenorhabditis tropicalis TaxID=1561998 RepID=A0A1I7TV24_9PELO
MGTVCKDNSENQVIESIGLANGYRILDYKVVRFIAKGAFGAVYQVNHINTLPFALKLETRNADIKNLKMDAVVLRTLLPIRSPYFCRLYFCGRAERFNFIIMTLVGKNLNELRVSFPKQRFSRSSGLQLGIQMISAIQQLHSVGFIHRDVKPANFCISLDNPRQLVMVDFGMCRKYVNEGGTELRHPRWFVHGFKGTVRYAPLAAHHGRDSSRKEDLESVFYVLVEMLVGTLPWMVMEETVHVEHAKQVARTSSLHEFLSGCPKQLVHILFYIDNLRFYDSPDYSLIRGLLNNALEKCSQECPYEWEEEMKQERKKSEYLRSKEEIELEDG